MCDCGTNMVVVDVNSISRTSWKQKPYDNLELVNLEIDVTEYTKGKYTIVFLHWCK